MNSIVKFTLKGGRGYLDKEVTVYSKHIVIQTLGVSNTDEVQLTPAQLHELTQAVGVEPVQEPRLRFTYEGIPVS